MVYNFADDTTLHACDLDLGSLLQWSDHDHSWSDHWTKIFLLTKAFDEPINMLFWILSSLRRSFIFKKKRLMLVACQILFDSERAIELKNYQYKWLVGLNLR